MLRWAPYPFVRVTLSFIAGILLCLFAGQSFEYTWEVFGLSVLAFVAATLLAKKYATAFATNMAGIVGLVCFFTAGFFLTQHRTPATNPEHLLHQPHQPAHYIGVVDDYVLQKPGYQSTVLALEQVSINGAWQKASGKIQLSVPHDSEEAYVLNYGDKLLVKGSPQLVSGPANPAQFNYKKYLANKGIYYRHYLQRFQFQKIGSAPGYGLLYFSIQIRRKLDSLLRQNLDAPREYGISSALILGVKDDLDNSIRQAYAETGTMHVLAVSGLHVGLIFTVLMLLLSRFNGTLQQRIVGAATVLAFLWLYAFVTGLSPSVLRAVLMFSLVSVGLAIRRNTNIYNTVAAAALVLLFINPYNLLEVGFQLSFLAVLGIVYMQPRLYSLLVVNNWLLDKIWALFTVAIAAQLATLPLGLFYFHQFPLYFWLANIVVVPLATLVLYSGMAALVLSWVPFVGWLLFKVHFGFIWMMNEFNLWVQQLPQALVNGIDITLLQTILLYLLLLAFILFMAMKKLRYLYFATGLVAVLSVQEVLEGAQQKSQRMQAVYSLRGSTGLAFFRGQQATVLADSALLQDQENYAFNMQPHMWRMGVQQPDLASLQHHVPEGFTAALLPDSNLFLMADGKRWLILSHPLGVAPAPAGQLGVDYVLLRENVRIKPSQLQSYTFDNILLDGSSSPWYRAKMREELHLLKLPYHDVMESGAFVVDVANQP